MESLFIQSLIASKTLLYPLIFLGMVFEGDIFLFTTAFLIHRHILPWNGIVIAIGAGVFIGDLSWYYPTLAPN